MPQRKSAQEELKKNIKRRAHNLAVKSKVKKTVKQFMKAVDAKDQDTAKKLLPEVYKVIDQAASKKILHKNKASRQKAQLSHRLTRITP